MPSTFTPFGLVPIRHPSGLVRPEVQRQTKALIEGTPTLRQYQPVAIDTDGSLTTVAANNVSMIGVFMGVEYTDLGTGRPAVANQWITGQTVKDLGLDSARVIFTRDPKIVYHIQANGPLTAAVLGEQLGIANFTDGNATTGLSGASADASGVGTGQDMFRILGLDWAINVNGWDDLFPIIEVEIAQHQDVADKAGY